MCECTNQPKSASEACDAACQAAASTFSYNSGTSQYCCTFPCDSSNPVCKTASELGMFTGGGTVSGTIASMKSSSTGMQGSQQCPPTMMAFKPACATDIYAARRMLNSTADRRDLAALASTYDQTLICLTSSDSSVTWDVSATSFPTYNKDHPLNDDTSFDSSSFETLKYKLVNGGVAISTFTYSFSAVSGKIALAFNDYTFQSKLTVVALNRDSCPNPVMPLNAETLASVGISEASFLELTPMEWWLILFPIFFMFIAIGYGVLTKFLEDLYEKRRIANLKKKKEFIREDGSVDRIQYLKDLYKVLKIYLDNLNDDDPIKAILNNDNDEMEKLKQGEVADDIKTLVQRFFDDLRFQDGELVEDKILAESTDPSDEQRSGEEESEDFSNEGLVIENEMDDDDDEYEGDMEGESQDADPLDLNDLLGDEDDRIEELSEDDEDEKDIDAILSMKKENDRKRKDYEDG